MQDSSLPLIAIAVLGLLFELSGCTSGDTRGQSKPIYDEVPLGLATIFHEKLSLLCSQNGLTATYHGPLAERWSSGLAPSFDERNRWVVTRRVSGGDFNVAPFLSDREADPGIRDGSIKVEYICDLRLHAHVRNDRDIPINFGHDQVAIEVLSIVGKISADDKIPSLNLTIRDFLNELNRPTSFDSFFGIRSQE